MLNLEKLFHKSQAEKEPEIEQEGGIESEKEFEEEVAGFVLWHGSGFTGITRDNISIDRNNEEMKKVIKHKGTASSKPEYYGFYATDSKEYARKYDGENSQQVQDIEKELEAECEEKKIFEIKNQADALSYYMVTRNLSYQEAVKTYEEEVEEEINPFFNKEYTNDELLQISIGSDYNRLFRNRLEERGIGSTLYKLIIDEQARLGNIKDVLGSDKLIETITAEDYKTARDLGYDLLFSGGIMNDKRQYAILNKDVVRKIEKSRLVKSTRLDEETGKEIIDYTYPEFEN
ncbi:hypothetical protein CVU83_00300 [Candidatus Falkowbacteria bacterium HGW-Falkowbacteria-2]|uniref:Uncharacterized protein n=1 Tax=Candidatus Falkowbacteria bacterium HGW-Falkowbacteria-2 TaxID=2013769 RepID=A0A2N2E3Q4_9BACT|nr:MAG: hypothetical protein CVU83_00300 [Candidatus Falkowbacteria bacterium HGW-Falkowbacteria-2]